MGKNPGHRLRSLPPQPYQHLNDPRDLVLRARRIRQRDVTEHTEEIDGGSAFHRGSLRHREEVQAVASGASSAAFGERKRNRRGSAFKLIAQ